MTISSSTIKQFSSPHHYLSCAISSIIMKLTSMESGHAPPSHPPWGCCSPRNPPRSGELEVACAGAVMDGCALTPEDDWKAENNRLQTQMGFDMDSELVPCHLINGGKREDEEGERLKQWERGNREKAWGVFEVNILVSWNMNRERVERKRQKPYALQSFFCQSES